MVELLVVISILLILMSLLSPSLKRLHNKSQLLECANNLRYISTAYHSYAEDEDDYVADCDAVGSILQSTIFNNQRGWRSIGRFYKGYLGRYMESTNAFCQGTVYEQGLKTFSRNEATYTASAHIYRMLRTRSSDYTVTKDIDLRMGWDKYTSRPVFYDPVISKGAWIGRNGHWDGSKIKIHEGLTDLPILMSDGRVFMFDRIEYPTTNIIPTGYNNGRLFVDMVFKQANH